MRPVPGDRTKAIAAHGAIGIPCALGRSGPRARKREGDGATPTGRWRLVEVFYRADRVSRPSTRLPVRTIRAFDGWCDAPDDRNYNRRVCLPYPASAEAMWRADSLYDIVAVLDHNVRPRARNLGSAVFVHLVRANFEPTEGCVAFTEQDLRMLLSRAAPGDLIEILP